MTETTKEENDALRERLMSGNAHKHPGTLNNHCLRLLNDADRLAEMEKETTQVIAALENIYEVSRREHGEMTSRIAEVERMKGTVGVCASVAERIIHHMRGRRDNGPACYALERAEQIKIRLRALLDETK